LKRLLVTSDDFGMCHAINVGTLRAMTAGIVRSTNLMAPCPWFEEAARLCREHRLPAGVHLTLTCEWDQLRWRPLTEAASLRDSRGYFFASHESLESHALEADIRREFAAQVAWVRAAGVEPTHLDLHMMPGRTTGPHAAVVQGAARDLTRPTAPAIWPISPTL